jgi:hypothetical protein
MPNRNLPINLMACILLGDACVSCRESMSGFHAIQIDKLQAKRATYLAKMGVDVRDMNDDENGAINVNTDLYKTAIQSM